jgi:hypothetical protein
MKNRNGTLGGSDFYSGRVKVTKSGGFVNWRSRDQPEISEKFFIEVRQTNVVKKEFNV